MGGLGSGNYMKKSHTNHVTVEQCLILDINRLVKKSDFYSQKIYKEVYQALLLPTHREEITSQLIINQDILLLSYSNPKRQQPVKIKYVQQNYGKKLYLICPGCNKKFNKLYLPYKQQLFKCRICYKLRYSSTSFTRTPMKMKLLKEVKARKKLDKYNINWLLPVKPPRIHNRVFLKLIHEYMLIGLVSEIKNTFKRVP